MLNSSLSALLVLSSHLASSSSFLSSFSFLCTSSSSFLFYKTLKSLYTHPHMHTAHGSHKSEQQVVLDPQATVGWPEVNSSQTLTRNSAKAHDVLIKNVKNQKHNSDLPHLWCKYSHRAYCAAVGHRVGNWGCIETGLPKITVQQSQADNTLQKFCHYQIWEILVLAF